MKLQEFNHGWRWTEWLGGRKSWGPFFWNRYDAMEEWVVTFRYQEAKKAMGVKSIIKGSNIPKDIVRRLWRNAQCSGKIDLTKVTRTYRENWLTGEEVDSRDQLQDRVEKLEKALTDTTANLLGNIGDDATYTVHLIDDNAKLLGID